MENQPQPRPWFRLTSLARPMGPPPDPASRPLVQAPAPSFPRPTMIRPPIRPPIANQPLQAPGPQAPPPRLPSLPPPSASVSPTTPPKPPVTQKSPQASPRESSQKSSPRESPVIPKSPSPSPLQTVSPLKSPNTPKYPSIPRSSPIPSPPSSPKPKTQLSPPPITSSPAIQQEVARPMLNFPFKTFSPTKKAISPTMPNSRKTSSGFLSGASNSPVPSPRSAKPLPETPPESPKTKSALPSPPFFSLPPSQLKSDGEYERYIPAVAELKAVRHVQEKPKARETKRGSVSEDIGKNGVITISGENIGAVMELGYSSRIHGNPQTTQSPAGRYQKLRNDGKLSDGNLRGIEGKSKIQENNNHTPKATPSTPMRAFTNSNVQGINGSIIFNSTLSHHDPGVHLSVARKPVKGHLKEYENEQSLFRKEA